MHSYVTKCLISIKDIPILGRIFNSSLYKRLAKAYDVATNYMLAHENAGKLMQEVIEEENKYFLISIINQDAKQLEK